MSGGHNRNWSWKPPREVRKALDNGNLKMAAARARTKAENAKPKPERST